MLILKKTIISLGLAAVLVVPTVATAGAEQISVNIDAYYAPIQFSFDDSYLAPAQDQQGFIYKDSTYVPLRFVAYSLDKAVDWDPDTYTVTIREPGKSEKVTINEYKLNRKTNKLTSNISAAALQATSIPVYFENVKYVFDGKVKQPSADLPGLIYDGSLYVPLRFVSESVGRKIEWDPATYTVKAIVTEVSPKPSTTPAPSPSPTAAPANPGGGGGGAPSGGGNTNPTQNTLFLQVVSDLGSLKLDAEANLKGYQADYAAAATAEEKAAIEAEARSYYDQVVNQFNARVNTYESQLTQYGYSTSSVEELRQAFEDTVAKEKANIGQ